MKRQLITMFAFVSAVVMLTGVQVQAETLKTRIGELSFTHDFANHLDEFSFSHYLLKYLPEGKLFPPRLFKPKKGLLS